LKTPPIVKKIRTIIVDDEYLARRGLLLRLKKIPDIEIVAQCENGFQALNAISQHQPDLVFLDIQMPGIDGFGVIQQIQADAMPLIVFVTAFDQYAIDAFNVHAVDYVLKPLETKRLKKTVERVRQQLWQSAESSQKKRLMDLIVNLTGEPPTKVLEMLASGDITKTSYPEKITIKDHSESTLICTKNIAWVEAARDYMCIHSNKGLHILRSTMNDLEAKLDPKMFQRIHRSTIVNLEMIEKVCSHINGEYFLELKDGSRLKMSRTYRDKIKHVL
jgi:two-component system LytT family response regulator